MIDQIELFEFLDNQLKITKPIRLIELFGGIGAQAKALENLNVPFEHYKLCEWAYKSIIAYNAIHIKDFTDYSLGKTKEEMLERIRGLSLNYNEPIADLEKKPLSFIQSAYNNVVATHNLVNIMDVKGSDLEIVEKDKYTYILTYSFPCQDLSLAGKGKGMSVSQKDGGTRSGLFWEVERILNELRERERNELPQILLMENVPEVCGKKNFRDFQKGLSSLEKMGYSNYYKILNAKDYGIPQNRKRCFMVSVLNGSIYSFPAKIKRQYQLKDLLEKEVDEKYWLSDKMIRYIFSKNDKYKVNKNSLKLNREIACSKTTREGWTRADASDYITDEVVNTYDEYNHKINGSETIGTIQAMYPIPNHGHRLIIKNATKKGYLIAHDGDGADISSRMEYHRGTVQKGITQTITTAGGDNVGVVVETNLKTQLCNKLVEEGKVQEGDVINHSRNRVSPINSENPNCSPTLTTRGDELGVVVKESVYTDLEKKLFTEDGNIRRYINSDVIDEFKEGQMATTTYPNGYNHGPITHNESISLNTIDRPSVKYNLRIRKLSPCECMRLMGFEDKDYEAMKTAGLSDASIYHCAGDSICVNVLMMIFGRMFADLDYETITKNYLQSLKEIKDGE